MEFERDTMIDRMLASDSSYDGRFITGVLSTGIYCLPSCGARKPLAKNVEFFSDPTAAEAAGLRACKRCRPPDFYNNEDPDRGRLSQIANDLRDDPGMAADVPSLAKRAGVSSSKLHELFRLHYQTTPADFVTAQRIAATRDALLTSDASITQIAFASGFETLSVFNENFRRLNRLTPSRYRNLLAATRGTVDLPDWFRHDNLLAYVGRDPESTTERVVGRSFAFGTRLDGVPCRVTVKLTRKNARLSLSVPVSRRGMAEAHAQTLRLLGLTSDPTSFEKRMRRIGHGRLLRGREGLTIPQTRTVFEGIVWVVVGQQVSLIVACSLRRKLAARVGAELGGGLHVPPTPNDVLELEQKDLRQLGFSQRKAEYLLDLSRSIVDREIDVNPKTATTATVLEPLLLAQRGLGPWSVHYLMMRSFGFADCVPIGDVALERSLKEYDDRVERPTKNETRELMAPFTPYRSLATFHLWARLKNLQ